MSDAIAAFVEALTVRGIRVTARGSRLFVTPRKHLGTSERKFLRANRADVLAHISRPGEPEPVVWTTYYERRVTEEDVIRAYGTPRPTGLTRQAAYEGARTFLADEDQKRRDADLPLLWRRQAESGSPWSDL